ncbi:uncharacterized protein LOC110992939 [Pieris rapae]|uniref:uncharacterized protein LOC110992939 n=1 Tax=Pieris rapae TaxID=64459 RepID=UPI001E27D3CD|nr:uncharacterized protein LOC110992939 [Pieris rapae]
MLSDCNMERLSHDLNLALEESNCGRQERRKLGFRRRTRSAGNLPAAVTVSLVDDGSSSSPPQAPVITQPLSDSDDPHVNIHTSIKSRHYCQIGNFESDSFNENFSPSRPANTRRKRKLKKMPVDYVDGKHSPPIEILSILAEPSILVPTAINHKTTGLSPLIHVRTVRPERNAFCGKRKWSHRDKGDACEMRERSFSGGCSSKSIYFKNDFKSKKYDLEKKRKESVLQPGKIILKPQTSNDSTPSPFTNTSLSPGSSSFNFVYKNSSKNGTPTLTKMTGYTIATDLPPFFSPSYSNNNMNEKYNRKMKLLSKYSPNSLRKPLQFEDTGGMECGNESSSLSSSDSDGAGNGDSDGEGDDELTDWPGIEELKVFNKSLTFKSSKSVNNNCTKSISNMPPPKRLKKENSQTKSLWTSKNRCKKKRAKVDSSNDEDALMSDTKTIVDVNEEDDKANIVLQSSFATFSDIKNAGPSGQNADKTFFQSFQTYQEKTDGKEEFVTTPRTNFTLQKTSSSDLNLSEKSPQSDHYCSENSLNIGINEVREIRAGCRRIREERPGLLILSAANEQLSRFLQDSCQAELKLPNLQDPGEKEKLESLAKLYSLELQVELGRPVLRKTSNTMQAVRVEHSYHNFPSDHKRRCYGDDVDSSLSLSDHSANSNDLEDTKPKEDTSEIIQISDAFSDALIDKNLLRHPGDLD